MTTLDLSQPQYVPLMDASLLGRLLCMAKLHDWSRWLMQEAIMTEGRKHRTIMVQTRECIRPRCGYTQVKKL